MSKYVGPNASRPPVVEPIDDDAPDPWSVGDTSSPGLDSIYAQTDDDSPSQGEVAQIYALHQRA